MKNIFKKAVEELGCYENCLTRWMLPDGTFLSVSDGDDHRNVGQFCDTSWLEFIEEGAVSIHYDSKARYLWIRTTGLNTPQRMAFCELFERGEICVDNLHVDVYDGMRMVEELFINDEMCKLYLTDTIAYQIEMSQLESGEGY